MTTNRDALNALFKALRREGLLARQRFLCCGGCASADLGSKLEASPAKRGAVYYHRQEAARLDDGREDVTLGYGAREGGDDGAVGGLVVREAWRLGLASTWNGDPTQCVTVLLPGGLDARFEDATDLVPKGATPIFSV